MKKINILYTIASFSHSGTERFVLDIARRLDKGIYNIVVFSDSHKKGKSSQEFEKIGAKVIYSKYHRFKHPIKYTKQLKQIFKDEKIDILHANDDYSMIFPILVKPKNVKLVAHSHMTKFRFTKSRILSAISSWIIPRIVIKHSDVRLGCGEKARKEFFKNAPSYVIPNGINTTNFLFSEKMRNSLRKKYKIKDDTVVLMSIGRLEKEKNYPFLVNIFAEYFKLNSNSKLIFIGDGADKEKLVNQAILLGLSKDIIFIPSQSDIYNYYNIADIFLLTSFNEGMPTVSIEAQINGLQCIFSDTITREADHSGRTLFLPLNAGATKWAKEIIKLKYNRIDCSCEKIEEYDIENTANKINEIYLSLYRKEQI